MLKKKCDTNITRTLELAEQMIALAHQGDLEREDPSCGVLYGILLDSGFKIRALANKEKNFHIAKGWWTQSTSTTIQKGKKND